MLSIKYFIIMNMFVFYIIYRISNNTVLLSNCIRMHNLIIITNLINTNDFKFILIIYYYNNKMIWKTHLLKNSNGEVETNST